MKASAVIKAFLCMLFAVVAMDLFGMATNFLDTLHDALKEPMEANLFEHPRHLQTNPGNKPVDEQA